MASTPRILTIPNLPAATDPRSKFEKSLQDKQMVTFFQQVKRTGAYYSAKRWEEDYQHQVPVLSPCAAVSVCEVVQGG